LDSRNNSLEEDSEENEEDNSKKNQNNNNINEINNINKPSCKICTCTSSDEENPLISPCNCSGSIGYIHLKCLKKCIDEMKIKKKIEENYFLYYWKNFECEICKKEYPKIIKFKNKYYQLVDLNIGYSSYVKCDYSAFDDVKKKTYRKGILVFKINDESNQDVIQVGRSQNNRIKLKDISVSRTHCEFIVKNKQLYIVDKGSKFGTLIYLHNPLYLSLKNTQETIISGKHWFSLNLVENISFIERIFPFRFSCCQCKESNSKTDINLEELIDKKTCDNKIKNSKCETIENKCKYGNTNEKKGNLLIDESYQDFILDLGNNIYIHQQSISEKNYFESEKS
jgi:hypothetical protein